MTKKMPMHKSSGEKDPKRRAAVSAALAKKPTSERRKTPFDKL